MEKVVALLCLMGLGLCFSLWGAVSVKLMPRLGIDRGQFGTVISVFMGSCLVFSLVMGVVVDAVGYMPVAAFGFTITCFCLLLLAHARAFPVLLGVCVCWAREPWHSTRRKTRWPRSCCLTARTRPPRATWPMCSSRQASC